MFFGSSLSINFRYLKIANDSGPPACNGGGARLFQRARREARDAHLPSPLPQNRPDDCLSEDEDVSDDGGREDDGEEVVLSDEGVHGMTAMS